MPCRDAGLRTGGQSNSPSKAAGNLVARLLAARPPPPRRAARHARSTPSRASWPAASPPHSGLCAHTHARTHVGARARARRYDARVWEGEARPRGARSTRGRPRPRAPSCPMLTSKPPWCPARDATSRRIAALPRRQKRLWRRAASARAGGRPAGQLQARTRRGGKAAAPPLQAARLSRPLRRAHAAARERGARRRHECHE